MKMSQPRGSEHGRSGKSGLGKFGKAVARYAPQSNDIKPINGFSDLIEIESGLISRF